MAVFSLFIFPFFVFVCRYSCETRTGWVVIVKIDQGGSHGASRFFVHRIDFLLMLSIPNLIWLKHQPVGYSPRGENKVLLILERAGQILVFGTALIFKDFNPRP